MLSKIPEQHMSPCVTKALRTIYLRITMLKRDEYYDNNTLPIVRYVPLATTAFRWLRMNFAMVQCVRHHYIYLISEIVP